MTELLFDEDFIPEIEENLEGFESIFLDLSPGEISEENINKIAFYAHNFKGSSQIAGLNNLAKFLHEFENTLSGVKKSEYSWGPAVCDFFFDWIDKLKEFGAQYCQKNIIELDTNWIVESRKKFQTGELTSSKVIETDEPVISVANEPSPEKPVAQKNDSSNGEGNNGGDGKKNADAGQSTEFIRTSIEKLDVLLNYVGELVVNQAVLNNHRDSDSLSSKGALETVEYLDKIVPLRVIR
jgi:two-component system chemotaxis sensor kinase CheA